MMEKTRQSLEKSLEKSLEHRSETRWAEGTQNGWCCCSGDGCLGEKGNQESHFLYLQEDAFLPQFMVGLGHQLAPTP